MDDDTSALRPVPPRRMSAEAMIGLGITIATIGVLFLLLGWAQQMREVKESMMIFLLLGAVFFVVGLVLTANGGKRKTR